MGGRVSKGTDYYKYKYKYNDNNNDNNNNNNNDDDDVVHRSYETTTKIRRNKDGDGDREEDDEFYDGIPRYETKKKSRFSHKPTSRTAAKVSEVSSVIGRASSVGLERVVEVLDTLGSSMTNLNPKSGFVSAVTTKGSELSILAFEVANTIVKGSSLMQSLSRRSIWQLKEIILPSEGVQKLISTDIDELLKIVAADKREELKVFSGEVVRFGNRCKDPQWHNLDRFFDKQMREHSYRKQSREEAESVMQHLMILVQHTAELYHELHILDRFEQDYQLKRQEDSKSNTTPKGNTAIVSVAELKSQRKLIRNLKKGSLWSRSLEEVTKKLVDVVLFLNQELSDAFGNAVVGTPAKGSFSTRQRLGPAGLALHYANIVLQIDSIVAKSSAIPPNARDTLYQSLPPRIKSSLRSKLYSFHVKKELTIADIKAEMDKTLEWFVPIATNTAKAHHGFGWVGEWANMGSESNQKSVAPTEFIQIETLHHADEQKTEVYILELVLWLNHLVNQSNISVNDSNARRKITPIGLPLHQTNEQPKVHDNPLPSVSVEDQEMQRDMDNEKQTRETSESHDNRPKELGKLS